MESIAYGLPLNLCPLSPTAFFPLVSRLLVIRPTLGKYLSIIALSVLLILSIIIYLLGSQDYLRGCSAKLGLA